MSTQNILAEISIQVEGHNGSVDFNTLSLDQKLADVNHFSFNWRQEQGEGSLSAFVSFNKSYLGKEVTISINDDFLFKGIICAINCIEQDLNGINYEIAGKGLFAKLDEVAACNSFYQKDLAHIFNALNVTRGTDLQLNPTYTEPLYYSVQYNQTAFEYYCMLATRYGEWLYYNGQELILGVPQDEAIDVPDTEIYGLTFRSRLEQAPVKTISYDSYLGEVINSEDQIPSPGGTGFIAANLEAGAAIASLSDLSNFSLSKAANRDRLSSQSLLLQQATASSSTVITGQTYKRNLKLGGKISITDNQGNQFGEYIITELRHRSTGPSNYENFFSAVPAEASVPPYTDPLVHASCPAQIAVVVDNEDEDGHDRIKVRFPWQPATETTPWIRVVSPHAGNGYGMRFLPEVEDLVYIDFTDNDPEQPFLLGGLYTGSRKSGTSQQGNHIKSFGTRSGRKLQIDDNNGELMLTDFSKGKEMYNFLALQNKDDNCYTTIQSRKSNSESTVFFVDASKGFIMNVMEGTSPILSIELQKDEKKLKIFSKGSIDISADNSISLSAGTITLNASKELKLQSSDKVKMNGKQASLKSDTGLEIEATTDLKLSGLNTTVQGNAQLDLKSGAMVKATAALVKIN